MDNLVENILTSIAAIIKAEGENVKHWRDIIDIQTIFFLFIYN